jgi:hypothetical protein
MTACMLRLVGCFFSGDIGLFKRVMVYPPRMAGERS